MKTKKIKRQTASGAVSTCVVLPCDLPLWPSAQELLLRVEAAREMDLLCDLLLRLHRLCSVSPGPSPEADRSEEAAVQALGVFAAVVRTQVRDSTIWDSFCYFSLSCHLKFFLYSDVGKSLSSFLRRSGIDFCP